MKTVYPDKPINDYNEWMRYIYSLINSPSR